LANKLQITIAATLAKNAGVTLNSELKKLVIDAIEVPIKTSTKAIQNATRNVTGSGSTNATTGTNANKLYYQITEASAKLKTLNVQWQKQGLLVGEFDVKAKKLKTTLSKVFDTESMRAYNHDLKMIKEEAALFNAQSSKSLADSSLETMNRNLTVMPEKIAKLQLNFNKLNNVPQDIANEVANLNNQLNAVNQAKEPDNKIREFNALSQSMQKLTAQFGLLNTKRIAANKQLAFIEKQLQKKNEITSYMNTNTVAAKKYAAEFDEAMSLVRNALNPDDLQKASNNFNTLTSKIKVAGDTGIGVFQGLWKDAKKFFAWTITSGGVMLAINSLRKMITNVREIDTQMTELKKVTDETDSTYSKFLDRASEKAIKLGSSIKDLVGATAEFARTGYGLEESSKLAEVATIYKNVGDGVTDIGNASSVLISTMKAFNLTANDSLHIVDALNEVGNKYSVGSTGLGESLRRSASALASANNTFEESLGLITAMNEILQDDEEAGRQKCPAA
jgi:predicted  nucleic acid-binding Zn-ribbon protein